MFINRTARFCTDNHFNTVLNVFIFYVWWTILSRGHNILCINVIDVTFCKVAKILSFITCTNINVSVRKICECGVDSSSL